MKDLSKVMGVRVDEPRFVEFEKPYRRHLDAGCGGETLPSLVLHVRNCVWFDDTHVTRHHNGLEKVRG